MTPVATARRAAATENANARTAGVPRLPSEAPSRRPPLRVVERRSRRHPLHRSAPRRVAVVLSLGVVVASLLSVIVGHALLAQGQVRLAAIQSALSSAQDTQRQEILAVAELETPSRIVGAAQQQLHMVSPGQIEQVPYVSLNVALPTPAVGPAPATTAVSPSAAAPGG